jgi:urease accessory protein
MPRRNPIALATLAAVSAVPLPALAHHPMGGAVPTTAWHGLVSGIAHPVIGLDHLAFLVAAGVLAAAIPRRGGIWALVAFLAAGLVGALLHFGGAGLGPVEAAVALSVLLVGAALLAPPARLPLAAPGWLALAFAIAGLFHGHAYAEAVAGAGPAPVVAYLLALVAMQAALGLGVMALARRLGAEMGGAVPQRRWAGMAATAVGAVAFGLAVIA